MVSGSVEKQVDPEASVHTTYPEQQNIGSASSEKIVEDVIRDSKGASDQQAGLIRIEKYGIKVQFHPSEILGVDDIQAVLEVPVELADLLTEDQSIICVGIKASPSDAKFKYPIKVTIPHSAIFTSPDTASIGIYHRKNSSDSFSLISAANDDPRCDVRERDLDLYISHFSEWWIVALFTNTFLGKHVICTPFIPKPSTKNTAHLLKLCIRERNNYKPEPEPGYVAPIEGESFFVAWRSGDLKVTCQVDDNEIYTKTISETLFHQLVEVNVPFVVNTSAADRSKVLVRFTLEQSTKKTMMCVMNLSGDEETPRANRAQKSFHDEIDTSITDEELLDKAGNVPFADYHSLDDMDIDEGNNNQLTSIIHGYDESFGGLSAPPEILARGPRAQRVYAEAAKAGKKKVFRTRLMLVGQERVGKTSLKKTLTRQGFDKNEAITDGVETTDTCEISIEVAKAGGKKWSIHKKGHENKDQKEDEYKTALADEIAKRLTVNPQQNHERKPHIRGKNTEVAEDEMAKNLAVAPQQDQESLEPHSNTALGSGLNPVEADTIILDNVAVPKAKEEGDNMPNQMASLVEKMLKEQVRLKEIGTDGDDSGRGEGVSLSMWDFAGHDIYYSTHQVFLTWRAIYVIVFDLSKSLGYVVPPESRDKDSKKVKGGAKSELTWLEFINFWLHSIYAHAVAPSSVIKKSTSKTAQKSPPIFIVGTHRESVKGDAKEKKEKLEKIHEKIRESIMRMPFECQVVPKYYAIENSLEDKDEELVALRRHIEKVAREEPYMGEEIPLRWLLIEEALAADKINYMSLDQAKQLTQPVGMESERELLTMLNFYHDLGNVVYYGGIEDQQSLLRDMVILNPQWLIDVFKQVITILDPAERDGIVSDAWTTLEKDGILEDRLIQHMWQEFLEQKEALVQLMAKFDLICEAPIERLQQEQQDEVNTEVSNETEKVVQKRYYVPSRMTSNCPPEEIAQIKSSTDFYVDFRGFLPDGLFHRLMARTVRWLHERDGEPVNLYHRHISLMVDGVHHALIEMLPPCKATIKVIVYQGAVDHDGNSNTPPAPSVVKEVMDFVTETLDSLIQHWARRIKYDVCFLCPRCGKKKRLKDCFNRMSLQCGLHNIPTAPIMFKFGITKASLGNPTSTSTRPMASTVVDMPPIGASAAVGLVPTSPAREFSVSDAMLDTLARRIPTNAYSTFSEKLGIGHNQAMTIVVKHLNDYEMAARECLSIWKNKSTRNVADLQEALRAAELGGLIF